MPCYHPLDGWRSKTPNPSGKHSIVFNPKYGNDEKVTVPCGQCIGCRLERSRQWAIRCVHEASIWDDNCFLTLTYNEEQKPEHGTLNHRDFQLFMKKLRKKYGKGIRYFMCGEYGPKLQRPHYHACLFNFDFKDKVAWKTTKQGDTLYVSKELEKLWTNGRGESLGYSTIGALTFESAAYVARYITKKQTGKNKGSHYDVVVDGGEIIGERKPEYCTPSRRPGIAGPWIEEYHGDIFPHDFTVLRGKKMRVPKFYNKWYERNYPEEYDDILHKREKDAKKYGHDNTFERLMTKKHVLLKKIKILGRTYEEET